MCDSTWSDRSIVEDWVERRSVTREREWRARSVWRLADGAITANICRGQLKPPNERASAVNREHLVIAMPYAQGFGMAWNYIERVTGDLARSLQARGSRGTVAYPSVPDTARTSASDPQIIQRMFYGTSPKRTLENARWLRRNGVTHLYFAEHIAFDWRFAVYRALAGVRIVVHYHHGGGRSERSTGVARAMRSARAWVSPIVADGAICVSEFIRNRVVTVALFPASRCIAIRNAALPDKTLPPADRARRRRALRAGLNIAEDTAVVLCGARAAMEKGIDVLLKAFDTLCADLQKRNMQLPLLIHAGNGPDFEELNALRLSLPHASRMRMLGRIAHMQDLLSAADVAVLPSRYDDAFPLFAIEAMQAGLPVVVTNRGGLPEIVENGIEGYVIRDDDAAALADRLSTLVLNSELRTRMGVAGVTRIFEKFSYARMLVALEHGILTSTSPAPDVKETNAERM
jgi:glycosyltransferase involved in cell wall biosynthesis